MATPQTFTVNLTYTTNPDPDMEMLEAESLAVFIKSALENGIKDRVGTITVEEVKPPVNACKSKTHLMYQEAVEDMDVAAGLIVQKLSEARSIGNHTPALWAERHMAVQQAMEEAEGRIEWAESRLNTAIAALNAHFDIGCKNLKENN